MQVQNEPFKGYNYLIDNNQESAAKRIKLLLDTSLEDLETERPLQQDSIEEFINFFKLGYFQAAIGIGISYNGKLCANWRLKDKSSVAIIFHGGGNVTLMVLTKNHSFTKKLKFSSIVRILKKYEIPNH